MKKRSVNILTGKSEIVELTDDEIIELQASRVDVISTDLKDYPLNPVQFKTALLLLGITQTQIDTAIDKIADYTDVQKALAKAKAYNSASYHRSNVLFDLLGPLLGITDEQIDVAWLEAKDFR